ncbi:MAG: bifunctional aconitate hydratase 2/2-methylisocitrate dehydratase [Desulfobacterales bacterium]|jgi:aconitate hydratase 2/2-methylisocitrate dehydratase|nr:bifunctional aconitate hydratase 2/2-methylisocitrate dehydratase [Desulfobacterales bacterium]
MLESYLKHKHERESQGIPPKPLTAEQVQALTHLLKNPAGHDPNLLLDLIAHRVPAGVDEAAKVKADFLSDVAKGKTASAMISPQKAVMLLSTMRGGYNVGHLIELLDDASLAKDAAAALSSIILIFDAFGGIFEKSKTNSCALQVIKSWAEAEWFTLNPELPKEIAVTVFKVDGEINTDDFSPAAEAWSRPDIPLHALCMLARRIKSPMEEISALKQKGLPLVFCGDVVGTGSSRKSASNSLIWHIGADIPYIPNKRRGGVVLGGSIAPIFYNSLEDAGAFPIECDVRRIRHGDVIRILMDENRIINDATRETIAEFTLKSDVLLDSVRAGGRIPLIIGRALTDKSRDALGLDPSPVFRRPVIPIDTTKGFTQAQKIVGRACGMPGVRPGTYCEPEITTVGSQDTTGPMTKDELAELACLNFAADLVLQSFCHTAAYPKPVDKQMHQSLHKFIKDRGGVALLPGDGIIHAWLNRMILPDTVGTGGDSHTRFPIGISFPAGSGLVAFAAALGFMPLDMPESVLVKFSGSIQPGITIRDIVNGVAYAAIGQGLLTVKKEGKKNVFSGRIIEFEGMSDLTVEQAYELTNSSAERSAAASTIALPGKAIIEFLKKNIGLLNWLIAGGYGNARALEHRITKMEKWICDPALLKADPDAQYAAVVNVDLSSITEPIIACPNDPDDVRVLSDIAGKPIDEVFVGSCMTGYSHYTEAASIINYKTSLPTRLWITPATRMDGRDLKADGLMAVFEAAGARIEVPGCSLCMGNQARVNEGSTVFSTSTRNFPNRMGDHTNVYLGSARLAAVCAVMGRIPTKGEYLSHLRLSGLI